MNNKSKIIVEDVSKEFGADNSRVQALKNINLGVSEGEFVSIVGPSGCGKSTLLYMLGGFVPPSSGRLLADGQPIVAPGIDRGIVFQEYALFPWLTVFDNIAYGLEMTGMPAAKRQEARSNIMFRSLASKDSNDDFRASFQAE